MRTPPLSLATMVVVGLVCAPRPARAQAAFKVGTFSKVTCTAPCSQGLVAHGLGITPSALILWTAGTTTTENNGNAPYRWAFGVTDGATISATGGSRSVSASSQSVVSSSNTARRAAQKAITIVQYSSAIQAEADLGGGGCTISWDATNFCLNWTTNNATAYIIHFIAIGGSGVQAQVVDWTTPAAGSKAVTLAAPTFQPSVVLNFMDYDTTVGAAGSCTSPNCAVDSTFMLGAMDAGGHQWASAFYVTNAKNPTTTARAQRT